MASTVHARINAAIEQYVLGNSTHEQERLKLQARFLEEWTEQFMLSAGLEPGMRVLDLGCGMGDVSLLAARLVGKTGSVTGVDRDGIVIEKARERIRSHEHGTHIDFVQSQLLDFQAGHKFDAVVGRYVLLYQQDPVAAVAHAAEQVRPGGIVIFHEMDFANTIRSYADGTLFASLLPRIEQSGLATGAELDLDSLVARMDAEALARPTQIMGPLQFGAWARKPHAFYPL